MKACNVGSIPRIGPPAIPASLVLASSSFSGGGVVVVKLTRQFMAVALMGRHDPADCVVTGS